MLKHFATLAALLIPFSVSSPLPLPSLFPARVLEGHPGNDGEYSVETLRRDPERGARALAGLGSNSTYLVRNRMEHARESGIGIRKHTVGVSSIYVSVYPSVRLHRRPKGATMRAMRATLLLA